MTDKTQTKTKKAADTDQIQDEEKKSKKKDKSSPHHIVITETDSPKSRWYVVHTYSGHETKVATQLSQRVESMGLESKVHEILVPTQDKILIKQGKKSTVKSQMFPGYMLVKMDLTDDAWLCVRTTQGVTGFIGMGSKPTPLSPEEMQGIERYSKQAAPKFKSSFTQGEAVKIVDGPFVDFLGQIESIDEDRGKVRVLVSIFGRETPVDLDFLQIAKA